MFLWIWLSRSDNHRTIWLQVVKIIKGSSPQGLQMWKPRPRKLTGLVQDHITTIWERTGDVRTGEEMSLLGVFWMHWNHCLSWNIVYVRRPVDNGGLSWLSSLRYLFCRLKEKIEPIGKGITWLIMSKRPCCKSLLLIQWKILRRIKTENIHHSIYCPINRSQCACPFFWP